MNNASFLEKYPTLRVDITTSLIPITESKTSVHCTKLCENKKKPTKRIVTVSVLKYQNLGTI